MVQCADCSFVAFGKRADDGLASYCKDEGSGDKLNPSTSRGVGASAPILLASEKKLTRYTKKKGFVGETAHQHCWTTNQLLTLLVKRNEACVKVFSVESPQTYPEVKWTPALKGKDFGTLKGYYQLKDYFGMKCLKLLTRMLCDKFCGFFCFHKLD